MTICAAWIRKVGKVEELIFASDSRLRGYGSWDCNPKIFTFSRTDCAICFAGDTLFSYPMMIQLRNVINANSKTESRFQLLDIFKGILIKTINGMLQYKSDIEVPDVEFIFGGYCWHTQKFKIWVIKFDKQQNEFVATLVPSIGMARGVIKFVFIGDYINDARYSLVDTLLKKNILDGGSLDMEPLEIICGMLNDRYAKSDYPAIGGAPQMIKVYKSLNRVPFAVIWQCNSVETPTLYGLPVHNINSLSYPVIDPKDMSFTNSKQFRHS